MGASTDDMINKLQEALAMPPQPSLFGLQAPPNPQGLQALLQKLQQQKYLSTVGQTGGQYGYLHDAGQQAFANVGQQLGNAAGGALAQVGQASQPPAPPSPQAQISDAVQQAQKAYQAQVAAGVDENTARINASKMLVTAGVPGAADVLQKAQATNVENQLKAAETSKDTSQGRSAENEITNRATTADRQLQKDTWTTLSDNANTVVQKNGLGEVRVQQKTNASQQAAAAVSPDAMSTMVQYYKTTGQPPQGIARSPAVAGKFWDAVAQDAKATGDTASAVQANRASLKANSEALSQTQKQLSATSSYMATMDKNIDKARALGNGLDLSDPVLLNKLWGKWAAGNSDPAYAKYNIFFDAVTNEYAKIKSGALGNSPVSDSARREAQGILQPLIGAGGMNAAFDAVKEEGGNRVSSLQDQRDDLVNRITNKPTTATAPAAPAAPGGWGAATVVSK